MSKTDVVICLTSNLLILENGPTSVQEQGQGFLSSSPSWHLSERSVDWCSLKFLRSVSFCLFKLLLSQFRPPSPPVQNSMTDFRLSAWCQTSLFNPLFPPFLLYCSNMFFPKNLFNYLTCLFEFFKISHHLQGKILTQVAHRSLMF